MTRSSRLVGLTILVVEDDYYLSEDARHALEDAGASVLGPCSSGAEALSLVEHGRPDWALLDVNLGGGPDFSTAEGLIARGVPVIFMTGYDPASIPSALSQVECVQKPTSPYRIVEAVARASGR